MRVFALGASRHIGYYASLRFLAHGDSVTFLLRNLSTLEEDEALKPYIASGHATLVKGDGCSYDDVVKAWKLACDGGPVDLIMYTIGTTSPSFHPIKGALANPRDICTSSFLNVLRAITSGSTTSPIPAPKVVVLTSTGMTAASKKVLPLPLRPLYGWALHQPHEDKRGMEALLCHAIGKEYEKGETPESHMPKEWQKLVPAGVLGSSGGVIIRAAMLTDGDCTAGKAKTYRAEIGDFSTYTVSRQDVAHFIAEDLVQNWGNWQNNIVTVGY